MMRDDHTDMGGAGQAFLTTHWSLIEGVRSDADNSHALIGTLLRDYWKPVYSYLRRHGHSNEDAKDLTQAFFHDIILGNQLIQQADPGKGRFRSFLLTALRRYLINVNRKETARKRIPKGKLIPLDVIDPSALGAVSEDLSPDDCFNCAWVSSLLERVFADVEAACHQDGKTVHWKVFEERVLQPIMDQTDAPPVSDICQKYGLVDGHMLANMITTTKRRIRLALEKHIQTLVSSPDEVSDELQEMARFFPDIAQNFK
jgi:DNA-directed RNA polymerase specialized sigma24 family protein